MARSSGTYTLPSNNFNPAVQGETLDPDDWNTTAQDIEDALTESVYTDGLGSTDNRLVRTDGTDTKKVQGSAITVGDDASLSGLASVGLTTSGVIDFASSDVTITHATNSLVFAGAGGGYAFQTGPAVFSGGPVHLPSYTVAGLPAAGTAGRAAYASDGRKNGEGAGNGTGVQVFDDGSNWIACDTGATVAA